MTWTLRAPQRLVVKRRNQSTKNTSLLLLEEPLKIEFQRGVLPYTLLGGVITLCPPFLGSVITPVLAFLLLGSAIIL
jgi:hypothetical protein